MKIKTFLAVFFICLFMNAAYASKLPDNVWDFIKHEIPSATQRFDSVVVIDKNNMYVPLYPAIRNDVEKISVEYTYPNTSIKNKPEVFILNNKFVFLKIFKNSKGEYTVTQNENLPESVKLGVMPQDMLVPTGLKIPESLKITMGDLLIPSRGDNLLITASNTKVDIDEEESNIVPIIELRNTKTFFLNNKSKFILVYDNGGTKPLYEIKLSGVPNKIVASPETKFALAVYFGSKTADVVDLINERVVNKIEFDNIPTDVDFDKENQKAYVTSSKAGSIYIVDLLSGNLSKTVKTDRMPDKIAVSSKDKILVFNDKINENVYIMDLDFFAIKKIANIPNLSRLLVQNKKIAAISRTQNKAYIYNFSDFENDVPIELISELDLAEKPTDALIYNNKMFILCSKDGIINVYDLIADKMLEPIKLDSDGFYSKITVTPNKPNAVITGLNTKKIIVIDLNKAQISNKPSCDIDVNDTVIIENAPYVPKNKQEDKEKEAI